MGYIVPETPDATAAAIALAAGPTVDFLEDCLEGREVRLPARETDRLT